MARTQGLRLPAPQHPRHRPRLRHALGPRSNQRISLRLDGDAATHGLLYAYDPTWQEYAVLSPAASRAAVDRAFAHATDTDIHMPIESFAQLVAGYGVALESAAAGRRSGGRGAAVNVQRHPVDVEEIRARHPLPDVVAAAGIELHRRGHGYVGCCPFHDDTTPSFSVDGVPDRFHCFGCGASGDVIDFVRRTRNLGFLEAVAELDGENYQERVLAAVHALPHLRAVPETRATDIPTSRAFEINQLAWEHFATPVAADFAMHYLRHRRGIDLEPLMCESPGQVFIGHASHGWSSLTDHLGTRGVGDDELLGMDLAMRTRGGRLIDTYRNRLIIPVINDRNQIHGFIGRDISGHPAAPKYRNPTHTPIFEKSQLLYRPTHHTLSPDAQVVVVEGALDALAVASCGRRHQCLVAGRGMRDQRGRGLASPRGAGPGDVRSPTTDRFRRRPRRPAGHRQMARGGLRRAPLPRAGQSLANRIGPRRLARRPRPQRVG